MTGTGWQPDQRTKWGRTEEDAMSDPVWVCEEEPGQRSALCCDSRCGYCGIHEILVTKHEPAARAAATRHRKLLAALPDVTKEPRKDECPECFQSRGAIRELRGLVEALESELNRVIG